MAAEGLALKKAYSIYIRKATRSGVQDELDICGEVCCMNGYS